MPHSLALVARTPPFAPVGLVYLLAFIMQQHLFRLPSLRVGAPNIGCGRWPALVLVGSLLAAHTTVWARTPAYVSAKAALGAAALGEIVATDLPKQGQVVYEQIQRGGPFAFEKDASVFGNYEQRLPRQARGYYREYTVAYNAASRSRGPRRIVCGGWQARSPDACYYSADHYNSFLRITPVQLRSSQRIKAQFTSP